MESDDGGNWDPLSRTLSKFKNSKKKKGWELGSVW